MVLGKFTVDLFEQGSSFHRKWIGWGVGVDKKKKNPSLYLGKMRLKLERYADFVFIWQHLGQEYAMKTMF